MVDLGLSKSLSSLVSNKFITAERSSQLIFSSTEVAIIKAARGVALQSRYCPALAKKPTSEDTKDDKKPKQDPFENPSPDLLISSIPTSKPTHNIVLNKFPIIKNHFILSTISWKSQTALLDPEDLAVTHALLQKWPDSNVNGSLFAFFNSGPDSGASQPHRHIQFLPIEDMMTPETKSTGWRPAIEYISSECRHTELYAVQGCTAFPFAHFACRLPHKPDPEALHAAYLSLYATAMESIPPAAASDFSITNKSPDPASDTISYNLAMTTTVMAICPRRSEFATLSGGVGEVGFNGTVLAGTFMSKDEEVWKKVNEEPERIERVLEGIGFPFPSVSNKS